MEQHDSYEGDSCEVLYKNGGASYLQVLTSETNYFSAELNLLLGNSRSF